MSHFNTTDVLLVTIALLFMPYPSMASNKFVSSDYGKRFFGKGTYYGYTTGGNCGMRGNLPTYKNMLPVAINEAQYAGSKSCGACIKLVGTGKGIGGKPINGIFNAYVHDRCPECGVGDLDLSSDGDGIWKINWIFVPCPKVIPTILFEGSSKYYKKIQLRGLKFPVRSMLIDGLVGERSQDNFFVSHNGGGFRDVGILKIVDIMGNRAVAKINLNKADGVSRAIHFNFL